MLRKLLNLFSDKTPPDVRPTVSSASALPSRSRGMRGKGEKPEEASFDPYNSGAFDRKKNAWDKVTRK